MYLSGPINFRHQDQSVTPVANVTQLSEAIHSGWLAMRPNNTAYDQTQIMGGELFDGCPANVIWSDGAWLPEQLTAIRTDANVRAAVSRCRYLPAEFRQATAPAPAPVVTPTYAPVDPAPGGGITVVARPRLTPVATVTHNQPIVVTGPSGPVDLGPAGTSPTDPVVVQAGFSTVPMILLGAMAILFMNGSKRR